MEQKDDLKRPIRVKVIIFLSRQQSMDGERKLLEANSPFKLNIFLLNRGRPLFHFGLNHFSYLKQQQHI